MFTDKTIEETKQLYFKALKNKPYSSALKLGALIEAHQNPKTAPRIKNKINTSLEHILSKTTSDELRKVTRSILELTEAHWKIMGSSSKKALTAFRKHLPFMFDAFYKISNDILIKMVLDIEQMRGMAVCLIRKHLDKIKADDPFKENISYELLMNVDSSANGLYVNGFVKQCASLPKDELEALGSASLDYARVLIQDLGSHPDAYFISRRLIEKYSDLKTEVFKLWQDRLSSTILHETEREACLEQAKILARTYPEFGGLENNNRVSRAYDTEGHSDSKQSSYVEYLPRMVFGIGCGLTGAVLSKIPGISPILPMLLFSANVFTVSPKLAHKVSADLNDLYKLVKGYFTRVPPEPDSGPKNAFKC